MKNQCSPTLKPVKHNGQNNKSQEWGKPNQWTLQLLIFTISWATTSGTSLTKSNVNSMAPVSLYFPFSFLGSSTHSFRAIEDFFPSSSSLSSTLTPVSSAKNAWFRRSLMEYLQETHKQKLLTCTKGHYKPNDEQTHRNINRVQGKYWH